MIRVRHAGFAIVYRATLTHPNGMREPVAVKVGALWLGGPAPQACTHAQLASSLSRGDLIRTAVHS